MHENDDGSGKVVSCIYSLNFDTDNTRHGQMTAGGMTDNQRQCGCQTVRSCDDLGIAYKDPNEKIIRAFAPVDGECPESPDVSACAVVVAHECTDGFEQSLKECLDACRDSVKREKLICDGMPNKALKLMCKAAMALGQDACETYCRTSRMGYKGKKKEHGYY